MQQNPRTWQKSSKLLRFGLQNDAQGVLGRAPASKIGVRRAKVEHKTLEGRQKIDRQPQKSAKARPRARKQAEVPEDSVAKSEIIR